MLFAPPSPPAQVYPGAAIDLNFATGLYWGVRFDQIACSRASVGYVDVSPTLWSAIPSNTLRVSPGNGVLVEPAGTNLALWCRDLSNAAWVKVSTTAALTATGIDGIVNSASTVTATGAAGTILQTVVQASTADTVSFFLRRRTGSGTVEITANGVAFTDVTALLSTTTWYRASVSATLVNPVLGLRLTTSGDAVDVDFGQLETGAIATSPILTTTTSATRSADLPSISNYPLFGGQYTLLVRARPATPIAYAITQILLQIDNGTANERFSLRRVAVTGTTRGVVTVGGVDTAITLGVWAQRSLSSLAAALTPGSQSASFAGSAVGTAASAAPAQPVNIRIGTSSTGAQVNGYIARAVLWSTRRLPDGLLQGLTSP